jgi:hypothetical protein
VAIQSQEDGDAEVRVAEAPASGLPIQYLLGYRDAVNTIVDRVLAPFGRPAGAGVGAGALVPQADESQVTWGLQTTRWPRRGSAAKE